MQTSVNLCHHLSPQSSISKEWNMLFSNKHYLLNHTLFWHLQNLYIVFFLVSHISLKMPSFNKIQWNENLLKYMKMLGCKLQKVLQ